MRLEERKLSFRRFKLDIVNKGEGYAQLLRKNTRIATIAKRRTVLFPVLESSTVLIPINSYLKIIYTAETEAQVHNALSGLKSSIMRGEVSFGEVVQAQILPLLLSLLTKDSARIQSEAACILTLISTSESPAILSPLMEVDCARFLLSLMTNENSQVFLIHSLANVIATSTKYRDLLIEEGIVDRLITLFNQKYLEPDVYDAGIFLICNIFSAGPIISTYKIRGLIPYVTESLWIEREGVLADTLWTLKHITDNEALADHLQVLNCETITQILVHVQSTNPKIADPALEIFGNLSAGSDSNGKLLTICGAISILNRLLESSTARRQAAWILSNLVACGPSIISEFLARKVHLTILKYLDGEVGTEMAWVVCNCLVKANNKQIEILLNDGLIISYSNLLFQYSPNIQYQILDTLIKLLHNLKESTIKDRLLRELSETVLVTKLEKIINEPNEVNAELATKLLKELEDWQYNDGEMADV